MSSQSAPDTYLHDHPVFSELKEPDDLQCFMEHHVFAVWDFMSIIKSLQAAVAPPSVPWHPVGDPALRRFINELVLEEESDSTNQEGEFLSHFELYLRAMREVGADTKLIEAFVEKAASEGIEEALAFCDAPKAAKQFTRTTFGFIDPDNPHKMAAALAIGREQPIPKMFRNVLANSQIDSDQAPTFFFYLGRHIHLDEDFHGPMSTRLLEVLCDTDRKRQEAQRVAQQVRQARTDLWDSILEHLVQRRQESAQKS